MEKFTSYTGKSVPLMNDNIDTDQILPKEFLKQVDKAGFGKHLFDEWRYLADGSPNPDFILNTSERKDSTILVTGENFGSGSSREHAAWAIQDYGFKVIIAGSYGDIFYMNALKNGLLPIRLEKDMREKLSQLPADQSITVDLIAQEVRTGSICYTFQIDPTWKAKLISGSDDISVTLQYEDEIRAYEEKMTNY
ncbi:3-isopropylmalate dehydratase small subunit [Enterococcus dongliensis]|uniref:3-isopropylmalate dehydratase small subunit n=1 Tax=Enterococcus dongliensis TaxID=2559925 RepID=A0AAP5NAY2_9ENTE|nr:3-isopropylmalate dehydratase small subunit [Enterococcus dongliensis]MDT2595554.1 3-isopropylmalate dehydratase small subunit [Enterococcus dongliensis]MDT2603230.1 3-isopropylmalate dehydratase small subunit [Enterococcus dongliensis]MDT2633593.1 3-isopropylmalate dehydratase small subunit [Enterococcus dongliensis]MDT2636033.1 3-isopropylmalate dehydratase small subunit [Enterococcus dongliensis]MDT2639693.1 3-isopropylmalate dehydratase small subunit [Enterococcus dongliensis]